MIDGSWRAAAAERRECPKPAPLRHDSPSQAGRQVRPHDQPRHPSRRDGGSFPDDAFKFRNFRSMSAHRGRSGFDMLNLSSSGTHPKQTGANWTNGTLCSRRPRSTDETRGQAVGRLGLATPQSRNGKTHWAVRHPRDDEPATIGKTHLTICDELNSRVRVAHRQKMVPAESPSAEERAQLDHRRRGARCGP